MRLGVIYRGIWDWSVGPDGSKTSAVDGRDKDQKGQDKSDFIQARMQLVCLEPASKASGTCLEPMKFP